MNGQVGLQNDKNKHCHQTEASECHEQGGGRGVGGWSEYWHVCELRLTLLAYGWAPWLTLIGACGILLTLPLVFLISLCLATTSRIPSHRLHSAHLIHHILRGHTSLLIFRLCSLARSLLQIPGRFQTLRSQRMHAVTLSYKAHAYTYTHIHLKNLSWLRWPLLRGKKKKKQEKTVYTAV